MEWRIIYQFGPPPAADTGLSWLAIFGIVVGCTTLYMFISAITQEILGENIKDGPTGLGWPVILPWMAGMRLVRRMRTKGSNLPEARVAKR